ncbi:MAG: ribonuclease P protein component [Planctomycetaceae bacterium]|jgi:ribonuclease P protein component|nr:ribonuclease P protein component [Planctomycetaceae bacterium]
MMKSECTKTTSNFCFPKKKHLRKRADFDRVFARKRSAGDRMLVIYCCGNEENYSRLGLVVSRKVGKAHVRNRWKRLIREVFRLEQHQIPVPLDLVILPRQGATPDFASIRNSFCVLLKRLTKE